MKNINFVVPIHRSITWEDRLDVRYYAYRPSQGWKRLQKLAFWFLERIGAYATCRYPIIETQKIECAKVQDAILKANAFNNQRFEYLLVGSDVFHDLMKEGLMFNDPLGLPPISLRDRYGEVYGMKVVLVPNMHGMVGLNECPCKIAARTESMMPQEEPKKQPTQRHIY